MNEIAPQGQRKAREPIFNVPATVAVLVGLMWAVQVAADLALDDYGLGALRIWFGFIPDRFVAPEQWPGGMLPLIWSGFTHAFLHVDYMHLIFNTAWLAIFGTPVGRRYGATGVLTVFLLGALAGALVQAAVIVFVVNQFAVLIGASGGVAALTGAAMRFIFEPVVVRRDEFTGEIVPVGRRTATLTGVFANPRSRAFIIFWMGLNVLIGFSPMITGTNIAIAWEAHIGGFVAGLLLPSLFDAMARGRQRP
ncbi:rhomboid family intramembrane serine protease [Pelagibacterium luteolum]|uniref:Membrane associated serine protease, rhomboid family n=1 Tax=Pelagibacterium luteolum TaxID=440168 RepID=A0A1G7XHB6_9HYPH|nr:rhomboid family intramembrane serine protease [Pelagibacterium luteolum]SDG83451.1 Membrane associated serine protease, rhomboid family [Pelagibacterium luteolum]